MAADSVVPSLSLDRRLEPALGSNLLLLLVAGIGLSASLAFFIQIDRLRCEPKPADAGWSKAPGAAQAAWFTLATGLAATVATTSYVWAAQRRRVQAQSVIAELTRQVTDGHAQEIRYRQLFDNSPDAMIVLETAGAIVEVNPAAEALLGLVSSDLKGSALHDLVHPDDRSAFDTLFNAVDFGKKPARARTRLLDSEGPARPVRDHPGP